MSVRVIFGSLIFGLVLGISVDTLKRVYQYKRHRDLLKKICRSPSPRHFVEGFFITAVCVVITAVLLAWIPMAQFSWLHVFGLKSQNILMGPRELREASISWFSFVPVIFMGIFLLIMPVIVYVEEKMFREHTIEWSDILWKSIKFGAMHFLVGIPVGICLALGVVGFIYGCKYRTAFLRAQKQGKRAKEVEEIALFSSTASHLATNLVILMIGGVMWAIKQV